MLPDDTAVLPGHMGATTIGDEKEETRLYNIIIDNIQDKYDYNELIKIFLRPEDYRLFAGQEYEGPSSEEDTLIEFNSEGFKDKNQIKCK